MTEEPITPATEAAAPHDEAEQPVEAAEEASNGTNETSEEESIQEAKAPEDVPFPKKAVNALSRRDKQIGKLQAQLAAERAELAKYREQTQQSPDAPKEESFDNYGDYLKAMAKHEVEQEKAEELKAKEQAEQQAKEQEYITEREDYATQKARDAMDSIPEYRQLFIEHADVLQSLPAHIERAFLEAEEPALAFLGLAKDGKLEAMAGMSPARAAMEIGKAELRGAELANNKPITNAPAPLEGLKGSGAASSDRLETMSGDAILKSIRAKGN